MWNKDRIVALVGRPNVGKSRLFNRMVGKRVAIVHDMAGVTRDVNSYDVDGDYTLLDTGGIGLEPEMDTKAIVEAAEEQVFFALGAASLICLVVDAREGLNGLDQEIASQLRKKNKKVLLVINKVDGDGQEDSYREFSRLGFEDYVMVSAEHGRGMSSLHSFVSETLGPKPIREEEEKKRINISFIGRPNVGKSSLCNGLFKSPRLVVSEVAGTTRDSVEMDLDYTTEDGEELNLRLIDTAGVRKDVKLSSPVEYFSTVRSRSAIDRSDVVFLVLDAKQGPTKQDKALLGEIVDAGKPVAIIVNKWDLTLNMFKKDSIPGFDTEMQFRAEFSKKALKTLFFLPSSPCLFTSAKTGYQLENVLSLAKALEERSRKEIPTPKINKLVEKMVKRNEPRFLDRKKFKAYYSVQTSVKPFIFRIYCNRATKLEDSYRRYLEKGFIEEFALHGCPVRFELIGKTVRYANKPIARRDAK